LFAKLPAAASRGTGNIWVPIMDAGPEIVRAMPPFMLEDLGGGLGVTDPASGEVVLDM
jgi:hypothetical protein